MTKRRTTPDEDASDDEREHGCAPVVWFPAAARPEGGRAGRSSVRGLDVVDRGVRVRRKHLRRGVGIRREAALHPVEGGEPGLLDDVLVELLRLLRLGGLVAELDLLDELR